MSRVKGVFAHLDSLVDAIDALKQAGVSDLQVAAPLPRHEIAELIYEGRPSPVRWWTMIGAITGGIGGFSLASLSSTVWPMAIPGGKPIVSVPPFMVITFECTVLLGALATLLGLLYHCRLPAVGMDEELTDPRFMNDHFGILVKGEESAKVCKILHDNGAVEVVGGA